MGILAVMHEQTKQNGTSFSRAALPWLTLVRPAAVWRHLASNQGVEAWGYALLAQWLLLGTAQVIAIKPSFELAQYSGLTAAQLPPSWLAVVWQLILYALGVVLANALLSGTIWIAARLSSQMHPYSKLFTLTSFSMIPAILGSVLGTLVFSLTQPLTRQASHALALIIRPFTLSLASLPPLSNEPLSLGWVFASYLDVFGIWSLLVFSIGSTILLRLTFKQSAWLVLGVVISLAAGLTAWWRVLQAAAPN